MIVRLANYIADQLEDERFISHELREHYVYALTTMIERVLTVASLVGLGLILKELTATVIFLLIFFPLRIHTGGFHAKEFWQCYLDSLSIYLLMLFLDSILAGYIGMVYAGLLAAVIYIYKTGAVNHPNMAMDYYELTESRKAARRTVVVQFALILLLGAAGFEKRYIAIMSMAVVLCAALMLAARLLKQEVDCDEKG